MITTCISGERDPLITDAVRVRVERRRILKEAARDICEIPAEAWVLVALTAWKFLLGKPNVKQITFLGRKGGLGWTLTRIIADLFIYIFIFRNKSDHNSGNQSCLSKDTKKRREGVLENSSSSRLERGRKEGMQEGFSMPQSYKKRKDGVQEDLNGSSASLMQKSVDGWVDSVTFFWVLCCLHRSLNGFKSKFVYLGAQSSKTRYSSALGNVTQARE